MKQYLRLLTSNILLLILILSSCQKEKYKTGEIIKEEPATQSINSHANALPHTKQYSSEVATTWFNLLTEITRTKPYFSPQVLRIFTYSGVTLYESVVPGMPSYQSMYKYLTGNTIETDKNKDYYWPACANAAMARIASRIMLDFPAPNLAQVQALESSHNISFQSQVSPEKLQISNEFGRYVADVIYEWSKTDGSVNPDGTLKLCPAYMPLGGSGNWVPTPPGFFPAVGQCQGNQRTFVPNIANTVLAPPHPAYSTNPSSAFYQAANEVYLRRNNITQAEMNAFNNWRDLAPNHHPLSHMLRITTAIIIKEKLNLEDASVLFAKHCMGAYDAIVAVMKSKFHYSLIRPVTYIRDVMGHSTWLSFGTTPQLPSYPDELSATASSVAILEAYFGNNYAVIDSVHQSTHGVFSYPSLNALALDVVEARLSGGTSFRFGGEAGILQGRQVGHIINSLPFKKP